MPIRDASFLLPLVPFLKGNGLRNSISFGEPKLYVIQLRLSVYVLRAAVKRKQTNKKDQTGKKGKKTFKQAAAERKHNAVLFEKSQGYPGSVHLNYAFRRWKQN